MRRSSLTAAGLCLFLTAVLVSAAQYTFVNHTGTWAKPTGDQMTQLKTDNGNYNLKSPVNYFGGPVYMRYECVDKPGENATYKTELQVCCWIGGAANEYCGEHLDHYYKKGVYYFDLKNGEWFQHRLSGTIDWTVKVTTRCIHRYNGGKWLGWGTDYTCMAQNPPCTQEILDSWYLPTQYKAHIIMVKKGDQLNPPANWEGCPFPGCKPSSDYEAVSLGEDGWYMQPATSIRKPAHMSMETSFSAVFDARSMEFRISGIPQASENSSVEIVDMRGAVVVKKNVSVSGGASTIPVSATKTAPGTYYVRIASHTARAVVTR